MNDMTHHVAMLGGFLASMDDSELRHRTIWPGLQHATDYAAGVCFPRQPGDGLSYVQ